jgi:hypothetical protein
MFEDLDKKPDAGSAPRSFSNPPAPTEDIFNGLKESVPGAAIGQEVSSGKKESNNLISILIAILIFLVIIAAGLILVSKFLGFTGLGQLKDKFFPSSGQEIIINNENNNNAEVGENIQSDSLDGQPVPQNEIPATEEEISETLATETVEPVQAATSTALVDGDSDGLSDLDERLAGTDLTKADTDGDGLFDGEEYNIFKISPLKVDTDNDNLSDYDEIKVYLTDPNNPDTDADTYLDGNEVKAGYDPKGPGKLTK